MQAASICRSFAEVLGGLEPSFKKVSKNAGGKHLPPFRRSSWRFGTFFQEGSKKCRRSSRGFDLCDQHGDVITFALFGQGAGVDRAGDLLHALAGERGEDLREPKGFL